MHEDRTADGAKDTDTGVETMYGKVQCETATCKMDRQPRQNCGESLDAGGIEPVTMEINDQTVSFTFDMNVLFKLHYKILIHIKHIQY